MDQAGVKQLPRRGRAPVFLASVLAFAAAALALAVPSFAALPPGRALEQVSPVHKNGGDAVISGSVSVGLSLSFASPDGNRAVYNSFGAFAGAPSGYINQYEAERTPSGWVNRPLTPTQEVPSFPDLTVGFKQFLCPTCSTVLGAIPWGAEAGDDNEAGDVYTTNGDKIWQWISKGSLPNTTGITGSTSASLDGSVIAFNSTSALTPAATETEPGQTIAYFRRNGVTTPVAEKSDGTLLNTGGSILGTETSYAKNAVGASGFPIFFESPTNGIRHVYARLESGALIQIDASQCTGPCATGSGSKWVGATASGSIVYLSSSDQLVDSAPSNGGYNLYSYDISTGKLKFLVPDGGRGYFEFPGFWTASNDGKRVYVVSRDVLTNEPNAAGVTAQSGNWNNTYLVEYDATHPEGQIIFLGHGFEEGFNNVEVAAVSPDGRYAQIRTTGQISPEYAGGAEQTYLYDADTREIECLSCGGVANPAGVDYRTPAFGPTDSGSILFSTPQPLLPQDTNGILDAYLHEGGIGGQNYLLSSGQGPETSEAVGMGEDGRDVFFQTFDRLTPSDIDGNSDVYDARMGGGFPETPAAAECEGAGCSPVIPAAPATETPGSSVLQGAGNPKPKQAPEKKKNAKHKKQAKHKKKKSKKAGKGGAKQHRHSAANSGAKRG